MADSWNTAALGDLVEESSPICYGVLKPGNFVHDGVPLIRIVDMNGDVVLEDGLFRISHSLDEEFARSRLKGGELLLSIQGTVGRVALASPALAGANISRTIARISLHDSARPGFLRHWLRSTSGQKALDDAVVGTTRSSLNISELRKLIVPRPPIREQERIAEILDTLDEAIRKSEQLIAKLKQVKQGLLHDLLTRGIDDNGELRDPERHPEQFKHSPLGTVPVSWRVAEFGEFVEHIIDYRGRTPKKLGMDWGGSVPALSAMNVKMGRVDLTRDTYYGSEALYSRWMTNGDCREGDVLMTLEAPLGNVAQVPDGGRYILSQRVVLFRFDGSQLLNDFAAQQFRELRFQRNLVRWSTGTTATGIQRAKLVQVPVLAPPQHEQLRIVHSVRALEGRLEEEQRSAKKLRLLKEGLMDDLLTGRVRVTSLLDEAAA